MESVPLVETYLKSAAPIRRVLVPTDFSPGADRALSWALDLARLFGAEVDVLHVMGHVETDAQSPLRRSPEESALQDSPDRIVEERLRQVVTTHDAAGVEVRPVTKHGSAVAPAIAYVANERAADLIVVGTHGRRGVRRLMLGSVAEEMVRTANRPVLVVPPEAHLPEAELRRILVPVDFSGFSLSVLPWARTLSETSGAELVLLHVIEGYSLAEVYGLEAVLVAGAHPSVKALAHEMADRLHRDLLAEGVDASVHLDEGYATTAIPQFAHSYGADLLVMASHGRTGFQRFLLGSVTARVLRAAPCPVLVVRPEELEG